MQFVKVNFERKLLKSYLELLQMAQTPKPTMPVLNYFKIGLNNGKLMAAASSLELSIKMLLGPAQGENFGMLIDPKNMIGILTKSTEANVTLQFDDKGLTLLEGLTGEYFFPQQGTVAEFPIFPKVEGTFHTITLNGSNFRTALSDATHFAGNDDLKAFLKGVCISNEDSGLEIFGSDSHAMYIKTINGRLDVPFEGYIWPKKFTYMLTKLLPDTPVNIIVNKQNSLIGISETTVIHARNLEGNVPGYRRIIPKQEDANCVLEVNRASLMEIVDKVGLISPAIQFYLKNSILTIKAENKELAGKAESKLTATVLKDAPDLIMWCNIEILLKILSTARKEKVQIEFFPREQEGKVYTHSFIIREENMLLMGMCMIPQI